MIVCVSNFGEIKAATIDQVVVSITLKIENNNYSKTPPKSRNAKRFLELESLAQKYLTLNLKRLVAHINCTIILGQENSKK